MTRTTRYRTQARINTVQVALALVYAAALIVIAVDFYFWRPL